MTIYHFKTIADMLTGAYFKSVSLPIDLAWDYIDTCQGYITYCRTNSTKGYTVN